MYRRRRLARDKIAFSFDSFLDVVANVIGIIIKLILVTWVGARSYTAAMALLEESPPPAQALSKPPPEVSDDPLHGAIQHNLAELDEARARLLEQLRRLETVRESAHDEQANLSALQNKRQELDRESRALGTLLTDAGAKAELAHLPLADLRKRGQVLIEQIQALQNAPATKRLLRYHTPVSRTVHGDEVFFECRGSKVTFIDLPAFLHELEGDMDGVAQELRTSAKVERVTSQIGAFRVRYFFEKEESLGGSFRYGLSGWQAEPVAGTRGETLDSALGAGSEFRRLADSLDSNQTVVTFWVYPDSFDLFRRLRDYLYERGVEVAGRPLPQGAPIAGSRSGTKSRGQ